MTLQDRLALYVTHPAFTVCLIATVVVLSILNGYNAGETNKLRRQLAFREDQLRIKWEKMTDTNKPMAVITTRVEASNSLAKYSEHALNAPNLLQILATQRGQDSILLGITEVLKQFNTDLTELKDIAKRLDEARQREENRQREMTHPLYRAWVTNVPPPWWTNIVIPQP